MQFDLQFSIYFNIISDVECRLGLFCFHFLTSLVYVGDMIQCDKEYLLLLLLMSSLCMAHFLYI